MPEIISNMKDDFNLIFQLSCFVGYTVSNPNSRRPVFPAELHVL